MSFDFNFYSGLLLPAFFHGIIFTGLFLKRYIEQKVLHLLFMSALLFFLDVRLCFWMLGFAGWYDTHDMYTMFMFYFPFNTLMFIGPSIYFYFLSVTNKDFQLAKKDWLHAILPLLMVLLSIGKLLADFTLDYPFPDSALFQYGTRGRFAELDKNPMVNALAYASLIYYIVATIRVYRRYSVYVREHFATTDTISFRWLYNILLVCGCGAFILVIFFALNLFFPQISYEVNWYPYFLIGVIIYYVSINGYFLDARLLRKLDFSNVVVPLDNNQKKKPLPDLTIWMEKVNERMEREKDYLNPDLSLSDLALSLGTSTSQLSKIINDGFHRSFNDYINEHRVNEIIAKLKAGDHKRQTLLGLAIDSGFNSKATFNRSFKKIHGVTPKEFISRLS